MTLPYAPLLAAVQTNCDIADAAHAADLSLCTYLLQMREFYRWEQGLPLGAPLAREQIADWLSAREHRWEGLEGQHFVRLTLGACRFFDPFDAATLNAQLLPQGLVYGAGLAGAQRPGFFLAQLLEQRSLPGGLTVQVCGREHARGLFAPPAALQGDTIVLRRESMARWLWEKFETFGLRRADGPFKAVAQAYGLEQDFHAGLPRLLDEQGETLILHELGEHRAGQWLEPGWGAMRLALHKHRTDLHVRAVRDHLADLTVTLPTLLQRDDASALHFWFSGFDGLRQSLCPALADAYRAWCQGDGGSMLHATVQAGERHFTRLAGQVLALHAQLGEQADPAIEQLLTAPAAVCRH